MQKNTLIIFLAALAVLLVGILTAAITITIVNNREESSSSVSDKNLGDNYANVDDLLGKS